MSFFERWYEISARIHGCVLYTLSGSFEHEFKLEPCLKLIYHPLYSMNTFVTNKSKLPQDGGTSVSLYGVIGYHVTH